MSGLGFNVTVMVIIMTLGEKMERNWRIQSSGEGEIQSAKIETESVRNEGRMRGGVWSLLGKILISASQRDPSPEYRSLSLRHH